MKRQWTYAHTEMLLELYPVETIERTAEIIGFSRTTIKVKARKFGIVKGMNVEWLDKATVVRNNFDSHSFAEIADMIGATKTTVAELPGSWGLDVPGRKTGTSVRVSARIWSSARNGVSYSALTRLHA